MNPKKTPVYFSASDLNDLNKRLRRDVHDLAQKAFLTTQQYKQILELWVSYGSPIWSKRKKVENQSWRVSVVQRLESEWEFCKRMIRVGINRGSNSEDCDYLNEILIKSCDPVMFLNQCGVPPSYILCEIEISRKVAVRVEQLPFMKSKISDSIRSLKHLIPMFNPAGRIGTHDLRTLIYEFQELERSGRLPSELKRGGQFKIALTLAVKNLYRLCEQEMRCRKENRHVRRENELGYDNFTKEQNISVGMRSLFGAFSAVLYTGFREWFVPPDSGKYKKRLEKWNKKSDQEKAKAIIRNVKNIFDRSLSAENRALSGGLNAWRSAAISPR